MYNYDFSAVTRPCRVHSGKDALSKLPGELKRHGAKRAFVLCGRSVAHKTDLLDRVKALAGPSFAGCFDGMTKDTPLGDVLTARDAARDAGADLLIAIGGGSVMQGARAVAIVLAESAPIEQLCTSYPEDGPPVSPRLTAPKMPIVNVLTVGTSAQNRSGSPLKIPGQHHRLELFDPKTRPAAIFWDEAALATAPKTMVRDSAAAIYWRAAMNMGYDRVPPLVDSARRQAFQTMKNVLGRLGDTDEAGLRIDLCLATFLQNRELDDGGQRVNHWPAKVTYAFAAGLFHRHEAVSQGAANAAFTPTVVRLLGHRDSTAMCRMAQALGAWSEGDPIETAPSRAADALEKTFRSLGLPVNLSELDIPRDSADFILANAMRNYNSDPKREFPSEETLLRQVLSACWGKG